MHPSISHSSRSSEIIKYIQIGNELNQVLEIDNKFVLDALNTDKMPPKLEIKKSKLKPVKIQKENQENKENFDENFEKLNLNDILPIPCTQIPL